MDTRQIRYFLAVVEHGGFGRAATALNVAQPTMSQSVKALERDLGTALFHRASHGVTLSAAGRAFLGPARVLIRDVAMAGEAAGGRPEQHSLEIVASAPLGAHPGARLVGGFLRERPGVSVTLDRDTDEALLARVRDGVSALGLVHLPAARLGLCEVELGAHDLVLVFPPPCGTRVPPPAAGVEAEAVRLADLAGVELIGVPRGSASRLLVESALRAAGVRTRVVVESGQRDLITDLVIAGVGAAFMPDVAAHEAAARGAVVMRVAPALRLPYGLVHRPGELSGTARAFIDHALRGR
ncbi:LysR family transcriptional regulator [Dactylosporangium aurantiacum]|uniref:LysR family transcriptional regulator n=1 Tax=Dactylosporangium aurantiacum TaxID=35754 RepID=A0A9Q9MFP1_9ACTN|nr:LysR family transcriptional regulator [Dactylosporangium aurantiacum]MDG6102953.1 LysR family transcriptional regulator [Dactylosporangium aurantiacum]UWZ52825.1 LysR family transcriptional regulator [Dactylosporangium aurantiacum]